MLLFFLVFQRGEQLDRETKVGRLLRPVHPRTEVSVVPPTPPPMCLSRVSASPAPVRSSLGSDSASLGVSPPPPHSSPPSPAALLRRTPVFSSLSFMLTQTSIYFYSSRWIKILWVPLKIY